MNLTMTLNSTRPFKITPKEGCNKHQLRAFYMAADGTVRLDYKTRPATSVPRWRLGRVLDAVRRAKLTPPKRRHLIFGER